MNKYTLIASGIGLFLIGSAVGITANMMTNHTAKADTTAVVKSNDNPTSAPTPNVTVAVQGNTQSNSAQVTTNNPTPTVVSVNNTQSTPAPVNVLQQAIQLTSTPSPCH